MVLHDCNPPSASVAVPAPSFDAAVQLGLPDWTGQWCGEVWKAIVHLRSRRDDLRVFVLDCDLGVGVVTRGKAEGLLAYSTQDIEQLSYQHLHADRITLLNLKDPTHLDEFLASLTE